MGLTCLSYQAFVICYCISIIRDDFRFSMSRFSQKGMSSPSIPPTDRTRRWRIRAPAWRTIRGLGEIDSKVNSAHIVSIRHDYKPVYDCCGARSWFVALGTLGTIYAEVFSVELSYRIFRQDPSVLKTVVDLNQSFDAKRASSTSTGDAAESPYKSKT